MHLDTDNILQTFSQLSTLVQHRNLRLTSWPNVSSSRTSGPRRARRVKRSRPEPDLTHSPPERPGRNGVRWPSTEKGPNPWITLKWFTSALLLPRPSPPRGSRPRPWRGTDGRGARVAPGRCSDGQEWKLCGRRRARRRPRLSSVEQCTPPLRNGRRFG